MKDCVYLVGFMGVGKSHVGRCLSRLLQAPFLDADAEIERRCGKSIPEIFSEDGEEAFRDMESALLREVSEAGKGILSCGGGMVLRQENRERMKKSGTAVYLTALPQTIYERVKDSHNRPLLEGRMNPKAIERLMEERKERYEKAADIEISTDGKSPMEVAEEIQRSLFPSSQSAGDAR